jgi:hypothetical protein
MLVVGPYLAEGGTVTGRIVAGIDGSRRAAARGQRVARQPHGTTWVG